MNCTLGGREIFLAFRQVTSAVRVKREDCVLCGGFAQEEKWFSRSL